ncbi:hypothetical protein RFI_21625 [Reticulomyxa filosa]|uniref:Uncharacterized protein n=1 Tax=Reticulomyxa filosa TaxID=46433 RepID=X6MPF3_RETFI|nr:hypothetical protein RFI_21625 [Reticulomyxa filosa]|eukprot:ETO15739.1 hypothetical protein RFI_21625 [Reticulomyxa filosa]
MNTCLSISTKLKDLNITLIEPNRKFLVRFFFFFFLKKNIYIYYYWVFFNGPLPETKSKSKLKKHPLRLVFVFSDLVILANEKWKVKKIVEMRTIDVRLGKHEREVLLCAITGRKPEVLRFSVFFLFLLLFDWVLSHEFECVHSSHNKDDVKEFITLINKNREKYHDDRARPSRSGNAMLKELAGLQSTSPSSKEHGGNQLLVKMKKSSDRSTLSVFDKVKQ